jgi:Na+/proline symporter
MSLLASLMSAATLLGIPIEIYSYGTMYLYWSEVFPIEYLNVDNNI